MRKSQSDAEVALPRLRDRLSGLSLLEANLGQLMQTALSRLDVVVDRLEVIERRLDVIERENRLVMRQALLPREATWRGQPIPHDEPTPAAFAFDRSCVCRAQHFRQPYFSFWTREIGEELRYHRKLWEFVFICQVLYERGLLATGRKGLGFGVGAEPLSAYFAAQGITVLATDMSQEAAVEAGWSQAEQHAEGKESLSRPAICPADVFEQNVAYRTVDMNRVPDDLTGFDFCWSACALEHLGSIDLGLGFIERSLETLKPGGFAVHTTEYNLSSDSETLESGPTVLFRRRDFESFAGHLRTKGHIVTPFDFHPGYGEVDRYIDVAPYLQEPHLKMALEGFATTSIGVIVQRGLA